LARLVLDTNIVSQILRRNALVLTRLGEAAGHDDLFMCPVVFYELWRGLTYREADRQLGELNTFARTLQWIDYDRAMWIEAAGLWATRRRRGQTHDDADLLIAAFVRRLRATLVTNNTADFTDLDLLLVLDNRPDATLIPERSERTRDELGGVNDSHRCPDYSNVVVCRQDVHARRGRLGMSVA
jgi:predicted nucleic acid-binding protein